MSELALLVVEGEAIGLKARCEPALRTEAQLRQVDTAGRVVDTALYIIGIFELAQLGADDAEHHFLAFRHNPESFEASRALGVVFEEVTVDPKLLKQPLRYRIIPATGLAVATIAATEMDANRNIGGLLRDRVIDRLAVVGDQLLRVLATRPDDLFVARIAQHGDRNLVDLQVAASRRGEIRDLVPVDGDDIGKERMSVAVGRAGETLVAAEEMVDRRRGQCLARQRLEEREII